LNSRSDIKNIYNKNKEILYHLKSKINLQNLQVNKSVDYFIESYEECMPIEYSEMNSISRNNESSANANSP
jgi:hypothetical protein